MHLLNISDEELSVVKAILRHHLPTDCAVWVFGSRAKGTSHRYSDLDLLIKPKTSLSRANLALMQEAFSESDLPFRVDPTCWKDMSEGFRKLIEKDLIPIAFTGSGL